MIEWQPIETARRDGEKVLLFFPDYWAEGEHEMTVGYWDPSLCADYWINSYEGYAIEHDATHWAALNAPAEKKAVLKPLTGMTGPRPGY